MQSFGVDKQWSSVQSLVSINSEVFSMGFPVFLGGQSIGFLLSPEITQQMV